MKARLALSLLAVFGLLVAALYFAQQPGNPPLPRGPLPAVNPFAEPIINPAEGGGGDQSLSNAFTDLTRGTVFDEIPDPGERKAFVGLLKRSPPDERRQVAEDFLDHYPQSAFLAQAYEIAAKAYIDLGDDKAAIQFGREALKIYPENPLLLVPLADIRNAPGRHCRSGGKRQLGARLPGPFHRGPPAFPRRNGPSMPGIFEPRACICSRKPRRPRA